jgi:hypothetical protein
MQKETPGVLLFANDGSVHAEAITRAPFNRSPPSCLHRFAGRIIILPSGK